MPKGVKISKALHMENLNKNMEDVRQLMAMVTSGPSKKNIILRKSALVLFTACWEAFIEDLARASFGFMTKYCTKPKLIPNAVKTLSIKGVIKSENPLSIWALAESGWKRLLKKHGEKNIVEFVDSLHSPSYRKIDEMFVSLIGLKNLSSHWKWQGISAQTARGKLDNYLKIRGQIVHRVSPAPHIPIWMIENYIAFIYRLAVRSHNTAVNYLSKITSKTPWSPYKFADTK